MSGDANNMSNAEADPLPPLNDSFIDELLELPESHRFECKRIGKVDRLLESVVAFSNSNGGLLVLGLEDADKAAGRDRVYGIQSHPMNWDELRRKIQSRITESEHLSYTHHEFGCTLRDGSRGSIIVLQIGRSSRVHSIVDDGTFVRLTKGNREIPASEITELCHARGVVSAETSLEDVDFELLDTDYWRAYARQRFEIVQRYPVRVIAEAITNAVIHRDYRLTADIVIRIFSDRIEIESPGLLSGSVTVANIQRVRHTRNPLITQHLREFPNPPNLDAHEGVKMMFGTMQEAGLYPPLYITRPRIEREALVVHLRNQNRPGIWEQVSDYLDKNGTIANAQVRQLMGTDNTLGVSKQLKKWVQQGMLVVANPTAGTNVRCYAKPGDGDDDLFSRLLGKET
ncbi:MAG: ATP-binding protein [Fuerstiella sp.]